MPTRVISSWGNIIHSEHVCLSLASRVSPFPKIDCTSTVLPFGNGRSYGDSCLNEGGALLHLRSLDRFIYFDRLSGVIACEAGVLLEELLRIVVPAGWFPHVLPGTQYVTVGGAIANDVHGKNHHRVGTFGKHVRRFELLRSTGERLMCSLTENPEWYSATIGGLGLTGVVVWAELQLQPVVGSGMEVESVRFRTLDEFFHLSGESDQAFDYTVCWIDCVARGKQLGRGILQRARHSGAKSPKAARSDSRLAIPFTPPVSLVNSISLRAFNAAHYHWGRTRKRTLEHFQTFFFPLDGIGYWNRIYGHRGFYQYQCVIPTADARNAIAELLKTVALSGQGSFLGVLKRFGSVASPGMLSFPMPGVTLALDFPNRAERVAKLFARLDAIVRATGGRLYPAKDGRMPRDLFRDSFPRWREFSRYIDPRFSSNSNT